MLLSGMFPCWLGRHESLGGPLNYATLQFDEFHGVEQIQPKHETFEGCDLWQVTYLLPKLRHCLCRLKSLQDQGSDAQQRVQRIDVLRGKDHGSKTSHF